MTEALLLLGSNLNKPELQLQTALAKLSEKAGQIADCSSVYWSAPWGNREQAPFLNQALRIHTDLGPEELLSCLLSIEKEMGRERLVKWGSRTIDIDILYYGRNIITQDKLKVPHPEIVNRRFVLVPLNEIAPDFVHPVLNLSVGSLLLRCKDSLEVRKVNG